jgi:hypothetical protein
MATSLMLEAISVSKRPLASKTHFITAGGTEEMLRTRVTAIQNSGLPGFRNAGLTEKIRAVRQALAAGGGKDSINKHLHRLLIQTRFDNTGTALYALLICYVS